MEKRCPYCGSTRLSVPRSCVQPESEATLVALGIAPVMIQQCLECKATHDPSEFIVGSARYEAAYARVARG